MPPHSAGPLFLGLLLRWWAAAEHATERTHHAVHSFLLGRLHHGGFFLEPLLAVLADLLLELHVVSLAALAGNVLEHLALREGLGGVLLAFGGDHHAHVARIETEEVA